MFKNVGARFVLRAIVAGLIAGSAALSASALDGAFSTVEIVVILNSIFAGAVTYATTGALVKQVEPNIGRKGEPL